MQPELTWDGTVSGGLKITEQLEPYGWSVKLYRYQYSYLPSHLWLKSPIGEVLTVSKGEAVPLSTAAGEFAVTICDPLGLLSRVKL